MPDDPVIYRSRVRIERVRGKLRRAYLPFEDEPVMFSVHSGIAAGYGSDEDEHEPHAATLDYVVAAAAGWLTGTLGGALEARNIAAGEGRLVSEATGEIEKEDNVMVIRRIHVRYQLKLQPDQHETAERVHGFHKEYCPVARTIGGCVEISTELQMEDL